MEKIAVLVDSGCDVFPAKQKGIYVLPLKVIYPDGEFLDGINITSAEVYEKIEQVVPTTSLPSGEDVINMLDKIKSDGYNKVICVTLSSGLSGTNNIIRIVANDYEGLEIKIIDTKNISIGAGFSGILAKDLIDLGKSLNEVYDTVLASIKKSKVFFSVATLEYLQKGGRIGLVSSILGKGLNLKPIISCNEDGIYYTVTKAIGKKQAFKKLMEVAEKFAKTGEKYNICICYGHAYDEAQELKRQLLEKLPNVVNIYEGEISPSLGVHTGPGLLGIGVQLV